MKPLRPEQYEQIKDVLPVQRGNVEIENLLFLQADDDPEGRVLIQKLPEYYKSDNISLFMDKASEGDEIRGVAVSPGLKPVVPSKSNRVEPWEYDKELYKRRNEAERYFRRLKGFVVYSLATTSSM